MGLNTGYVWQARIHKNTHIHARTLSCCVAASLWRLFRLEDVFVAQLLSWWWDGMICIKPNPNCDCGVDTFLASCAVQDDLLTDVEKNMRFPLHSLRPPGVLSRATILHLRYGFND